MNIKSTGKSRIHSFWLSLIVLAAAAGPVFGQVDGVAVGWYDSNMVYHKGTPPSGDGYTQPSAHRYQEFTAPILKNSSAPVSDYQQQAREAEAKRQAAAKAKEEFERDKADSLRDLKDLNDGSTPRDPLGLKGLDDSLALKQLIGLNDSPQNDKSSFDNSNGESGLKKLDSVNPASIFDSDDFKQLNERWLRNQEEMIRQAVEQDREARSKILAAIKNIQVPTPNLGPQTLNDLMPGDVLLLAPEHASEQMVAILDQVYTGRIFSSFKESPASHAMTFLGRDGSGRALYLDHTTADFDADRGSHIIGQTEFEQKYGQRGVYIARPIPKVDGSELLRYALEAAEKAKMRSWYKGSDFGVLVPGKVVCSERARFAIARATGTPMTNNRRFVDVTPGDFFDYENNGVGAYFTVWGLGNIRKSD